MAAENDTLVCTACGKTYSGVDLKVGDECVAETTMLSGSKAFTVQCGGEIEEIEDEDDSAEDLRGCGVDVERYDVHDCGCYVDGESRMQWCSLHANAQELLEALKVALDFCMWQGGSKARALVTAIEEAR